MEPSTQADRPPRPTERVKMKTVGKLRNTSGHALGDRRPRPEDNPDDER